jgi:hypothetical protein
MRDCIYRAGNANSSADIALIKLESLLVGQVRDVIDSTCREVVQANYLITPGNVGVTQM